MVNEKGYSGLLWKQSQDLAEGFKVKWQWSERRGRYAIPPNIPRSAPSCVRKAREQTIAVHGARIFNLLPKHLRNNDTADFEMFKNHFDLFLAEIPDQPSAPGLCRAAKTNSLLDQVPMAPNIVID